MSSILEALKKLEEEKAARRGGTGNIAGKVTASSRRPTQRAAWLVPSGMAAVAVGAVLATYTLMGGFSPRPAGTAFGRKTDLTAPTPAMPVPRTTTPDGAKNRAPQSERPESSQQFRHETPPAADTVPVSPRPRPIPKHTPSAPSRQELRNEPAPAPQPPAAEQLPTINVTGIAWQQDSASRMAVLNGRSVTEGAIVAGARVMEILPDRVRCSFKGNDFEVQLDK